MYLYGASGHGKVVAEIAEELGVSISGFVDDNQDLDKIWEYPVMHQIPADVKQLFLSVGNNNTRKKLFEKFSEFEFPCLIHPQSNISKRTQIGKGTAVMAGVSINSDSKIGQHCIINTNASIDHECQMEDFVHISPNAALAGGVIVEEGAHIGIGASIIQGIRIGKWATVGAGAVVIENVPDYAVVVGNPARVIKTNIKH